MQNLYIVLFSMVAITALVRATNYCSKSICNSDVTHIACGNKGKFASSCPSDAAMVNIDAGMKVTLVNAHNVKRNLIAGGANAKHDPACRMATMAWDNELSTIAAFNVRQCAMVHDKCRNTDAYKNSGQNLAWMSYNGKPNNTAMLARAVDLWYSEVANSTMKYIKSYPNNYKGPTIGHFTVMVVDRNTRVGCAAATYSKKDAPYKVFLVACNYATTNIINSAIYASCKAAGTKCIAGANSRYPNLCSTSEKYDVNKWF